MVCNINYFLFCSGECYEYVMTTMKNMKENVSWYFVSLFVYVCYWYLRHSKSEYLSEKWSMGRWRSIINSPNSTEDSRLKTKGKDVKKRKKKKTLYMQNFISVFNPGLYVALLSKLTLIFIYCRGFNKHTLYKV